MRGRGRLVAQFSGFGEFFGRGGFLDHGEFFGRGRLVGRVSYLGVHTQSVTDSELAEHGGTAGNPVGPAPVTMPACRYTGSAPARRTRPRPRRSRYPQLLFGAWHRYMT